MKLIEVLPIVLACQNLSKSFQGSHKQETVVLADIDLEVCKGTFVTILGQSGGGKSTLLKLLGGFLPPSSGNVLFNGQPLKSNTPNIGMIFQDHNLYPWMTVEQNVGFGFKIKGEKTGNYKHLVHEILDTVRLSHARKLYPHQLSGGMKQRVAIARSIVVKPTVLLLDEPFSALDIQLRRRLQEFLLALWSEINTTMILVTHNVEEAILLGQKLVVVGDSPGRIVEEVTISDAQYRDRYHPDFLHLQRYLESVLEGNSKEQGNNYYEEILAISRIQRN